jgi:hypothetical protein
MIGVLAPLQDVEHAALGPALAVVAQNADADAVAVQHRAHFLRREIHGRLAVVADDETMAVAVPFDAAFDFAQQGGASVNDGT